MESLTRKRELVLRKAAFKFENSGITSQIIGLYDQDNSGTIGFGEFEKLHGFLVNLQHKFTLFDRDENSWLTPDEAYEAITQWGTPPLLTSPLLVDFDRRTVFIASYNLAEEQIEQWQFMNDAVRPLLANLFKYSSFVNCSVVDTNGHAHCSIHPTTTGMRSVRQLVAYVDSRPLHFHSNAIPLLWSCIRFCLSRNFKPLGRLREISDRVFSCGASGNSYFALPSRVHRGTGSHYGTRLSRTAFCDGLVLRLSQFTRLLLLNIRR